MKKKLLLVCLVLFSLSCSKDTNLKDMPIVKQMSMAEAMSKVKMDKLFNAQTITTKKTTLTFNGFVNGCLNEQTILGGGPKVFSTNGQTTVHTSKDYNTDQDVTKIHLTARNDGTVTGSAIAIQYPFKYGSSYKISLSVDITAYEVDGDHLGSAKRFPSLNAQLANDASFSLLCAQEPPIYLTGPSPIFSLTNSASTFSYSPDQCYEYLKLNLTPNMTGSANGLAAIYSITIEETNVLEITGPSFLDVNEQGNYSVKVNGFDISTIFNWRTTGDLQIIGSATGSTVAVKATSLYGGTIVGDLNGCQAIMTKTLPSLVNNNIKLIGPGQVDSNISTPVRFSIQLSGPLVSKQITNSEWIIPEDWTIVDQQDSYIELQPGVLGGFIEVSFLLDGEPAYATKHTKVFAVDPY